MMHLHYGLGMQGVGPYPRHPKRTEGAVNMAYSYACKDFEGMESCPGKVVAETEDEIWKLMELHAVIAHGEDPSTWDDETRAYAKTLIKTL
jgi:hypothetical protein